MYIFFYTAAIYLRYKYPNKHRPYKIPFKNIGMWIAACTGLISGFLVFLISFWPPPELPKESNLFL